MSYYDSEDDDGESLGLLAFDDDDEAFNQGYIQEEATKLRQRVTWLEAVLARFTVETDNHGQVVLYTGMSRAEFDAAMNPTRT
jgi:hypothetical protein